MGTIFSSTNDYNPALANRPRKSIGLAKFDVPDNFQPPLTGTLSIPYPVRISQPNNPIPSSPKEPPSPIANQTPTQRNFTSTTLNQPHSKEIEPMYRSSSYSVQPNSSIYNPPAHNDALIVSRSVMNMNNNSHHQRSHNPHFSSFRPNRSVVERNGKQFITEFNERVEKRYVEVYDDTIGRMRLFEVTDYIPSRTVRAMKTNIQRPNFSLNSRLPLPPPANNRTTPINLTDFRGSNSRDTVAREFDLYHSGASVPSNNNNPNNNNPPNPPLETQQSNDSNYTQPRSNTYNQATREVPNQYTTGSYRSPPTSFRPHSPTASDYSVETRSHTADLSGESDSEGVDPTSRSNSKRSDNNRNNPNVSYGTLNGQYASAAIDPFRRPINTQDPYYTKRTTPNNYSEPIANNRPFKSNTGLDYTPIPASYNQAKRNQYSYRGDSGAYDG